MQRGFMIRNDVLSVRTPRQFGVRNEREVIKRKKENINLTRAKYAIMQNIYNTPLKQERIKRIE